MNKKQKRSLGVIALVILIFATSLFTVLQGLGRENKGKADHIKLGLDLAGGVSVTYQIKEKNATETQINDTIYKLQKRIEHYSTEAVAYREGDDRISVEIPGVTDANKILSELGKPGALSFQLKDGTTIMDGSNIRSAEAKQMEGTGGITEYVVALSMDDTGKEAFGKATSEHIGDQIYIIYDKEVVSAPVVKAAITDGECVIEGMEDYEAADNLATTIRIGALPLTLTELRSNVVGATLGQDALKTSLQAGAVAVILIWLLMIALYRVPGFISGVCLVGYVLLNLLAINGFDITLTLPGIAGILLAIGMAVDANVIIFSRIKEELQAGRSVDNAINNGHKNAMSAILDGNITTIIAAIILYWKGSGTVKGFAQTLGIGVLLSMFMAVFVTKWLIRAFYELGLKDIKYYGKAKDMKVINFISLSKYAIPLSIALIIFGLGFTQVNKSKIGEPLNYDLEFSGGTAITMELDKPITQDVEKSIEDLVKSTVKVKTVQLQKTHASKQVVVKTNELALKDRTKLQEAIEKKFKVKNYQAEEITATVSKEMRQDAIIAITISAIFMLLYIAIRFRDVRFGASAVIALLHDVLMVFMVYSVGRLAVGNTFIACMLTIFGYSINATIVIFDRIRENKKKMRKASGKEIVNTSITQTLTRSINTTLTSFIPVCLLYFMGVVAIKEFSLTLICGVLFGAYSSVFITGPLYYYLSKISGNKKPVKKSSKRR